MVSQISLTAQVDVKDFETLEDVMACNKLFESLCPEVLKLDQ